ncbi:MAG: 4'-phosphopantetheinyl transferase superfamily protein [Eggerthellaceae bacterium]|nr:4'-phosphopantetheinyl transferase superfamily protein [Eggerthellaceae bacterium]
MGAVKGVGVDVVDVGEVAYLGGFGAAARDDARCNDVDACDGSLVGAGKRNAFMRRVFTDAEWSEGTSLAYPAAYFAGRFAAKEAVFKAISDSVGDAFDLRCVETLFDEGGRPAVSMDGAVGEAMSKGGIGDIAVSIMREGGSVYAFAFALAR